MRFGVGGVLVILSLAGDPGVGRAQTVEDLGPRSVGVGEALRAAAVGSLATTLNPAGVSLARSYVIEGDYMYRPDDHANVQVISLCDSVTARVGACLYYDHLSIAPDDSAGDGQRYMHQFGISVSMPVGESFLLGITQRYVSYTDTLVDANSHSGYGLDAGMILRLGSSFNLAAVGYNLIGNDQAQFARALGAGLALNLSSKLLIAADGRWNLESGDGRYGGGLEYFFAGGDAQQGFPVRAGYVYDAATAAHYITGGLGFITPRVGIDVGVRKQVQNGDELMLQFSLRLFMPSS
jgi:hypothetical protein